MELAQKRPQLDGLRRFLGTRRGAVMAAIATAAIAAVVLVAFVNRYKASIDTGAAPASVLVTDRLIPKGTAGEAVVSGKLFRPTTVTEDQVKTGALADAALLEGRVATRDIYPGQQVTAADFARDIDPVRGQLTKSQRAIGVPLDSAHGLIGNVRAGDHVDVLTGFYEVSGTTGRGQAVLTTLVRDVLVLKAPPEVAAGEKTTGAGKTSDVLVRLNDRQAAEVAFASDRGKVWLALRPPTGAEDTPIPDMTYDTMLSGKPVVRTGAGG
jgi:Flp pilus assembly protein CpaB